MSFLAAITQPSWITALKTHGFVGEVNFWKPGTKSVSAEHYGNLILFVQKGKNPRRAPGFAVIDRYEVLSIQEAWRRWGKRNGVESLEEFVALVSSVAKGTSTNGGGMTNRIEGLDTLIGCTVLRNVSFFPDSDIPTVDQLIPNFPRNVVSYKVYHENLPLTGHLMHAAALDPGQGGRHAQLDPMERDAIEAHAMSVCRAMFNGWQVTDVSTPELAIGQVGVRYPGYDMLVCQVPSACYHVEVKGTKLRDPVIAITRNELLTAVEDPLARLLVVSHIRTYKDSEKWCASDGVAVLYKWRHTEKIKDVLEGASRGNQHALQLNTPVWNLDVHNTDLLERMSEMSFAKG